MTALVPEELQPTIDPPKLPGQPKPTDHEAESPCALRNHIPELQPTIKLTGHDENSSLEPRKQVPRSQKTDILGLSEGAGLACPTPQSLRPKSEEKGGQTGGKHENSHGNGSNVKQKNLIATHHSNYDIPCELYLPEMTPRIDPERQGVWAASKSLFEPEPPPKDGGRLSSATRDDDNLKHQDKETTPKPPPEPPPRSNGQTVKTVATQWLTAAWDGDGPNQPEASHRENNLSALETYYENGTPTHDLIS